MQAKRWVAVGALLCLPAGAAWGAEALDGKALFEKKCTVCHAAKRALDEKMDKAGWEKTIAKMKAKGAQVNEAEAAAIAGYLVKAAGK
jgi:cytochrome c5